jgi:hypothetical protein
MTEQTGTEAAQSTEQTAETESTYTPPATQADLDRIISDRVNRTKSQFKDYGELKAAKAELDEIKKVSQTVEQRQAEELARWQSDAEKWRTTAVGSRVQALASTDFADPDDAVTAIGDLSRFLDTGGQIDDAAIRSELTGLLERKPHWRRPEGAQSRLPAPNPGQGATAAANGSPNEQMNALIRGARG